MAGSSSSSSSDSGQENSALDGPEAETSDEVEIAQISDSACSFVRRCIQTGEHTRAMTALVNVIEMADLSTDPCKRAVLLTAQILMVTSQHQASLTCVMDFYQAMPPPYSTADGCFIIARNYDKDRALSFAQYWWKKILGDAVTQAQAKADFCLAFAHRAFEQQDFIFAADGFAQAIAYDQTRGVSSFRVAYRYLFALLAFQDPNPNAKNTRIAIAWTLAQSICCSRWSHGAPYRERYGDAHFYLMRDLYHREFLRIYNAVFAWEDKPARLIARWWKRCLRQHQETRQSSPTAAPLAASIDRKKRQKKEPAPDVCTRTRERARALRRSSKQSKQKPNKQSSHRILLENPNDDERRSPSNSPPHSVHHSNNKNPLATENIATPHPSPHAFLRRQFASTVVENSPTKRKLRAVRNLRVKTLVDEEPNTESLSSTAPTLMKEPQGAGANAASLLDVYQFQTLSADAFQVSCGRSPGFADLDLNELEDFVRLAHYRARVLQQRHKPVGSLNERNVKPDWLEQFDKVLHAVYEVNSDRLKQQERNPRAHLTNIHARMLDQLTKIRDSYKQRFGPTMFTRELRALVHDLKEWKHENVAALVTTMERIKQLGASEEKQRNLEFFHVHKQRLDATAQ